MKLALGGPTYTLPDIDVNNQQCLNLFPASGGPGGSEGAKEGGQVLYPRSGYSLVVNASGAEVRGMINVDDTIYAVVDSTVYKLTITDSVMTATVTSVGTLASTSGPVSMARNPTQIMIVDGSSAGYITTIATGTTAAISDEHFTGGVHVRFLDSYFIYNTPSASTIFSTGINDGSSIDALDVTTVEGDPDKTVGLAVDKRELWVFGDRSVQIYWNEANAVGFPLSVREGAYINKGCAAKGSILNFDNTLMWLDHQRFVMKANGYTPQIVSNEAVHAAIQSYSIVSDAVAWQYTERGHLFYVLSFPTVQKTWVFDAVTEQWHERSYYNPTTQLHEQDLGANAVQYKGKFLVGARNSGKIFLVNSETYSDSGDAIHRVRRTSHQRQEFAQIGVDSLRVLAKTGQGLTSGTGLSPQLMMRYSKDMGYTWSAETVRSLGATGNYSQEIRWNRLGYGKRWLFEFRVSDPIDFALIDASVEVSGGLS